MLQSDARFKIRLKVSSTLERNSRYDRNTNEFNNLSNDGSKIAQKSEEEPMLKNISRFFKVTKLILNILTLDYFNLDH